MFKIDRRIKQIKRFLLVNIEVTLYNSPMLPYMVTLRHNEYVYSLWPNGMFFFNCNRIIKLYRKTADRIIIFSEI